MLILYAKTHEKLKNHILRLPWRLTRNTSGNSVIGQDSLINRFVYATWPQTSKPKQWNLQWANIEAKAGRFIDKYPHQTKVKDWMLEHLSDLRMSHARNNHLSIWISSSIKAFQSPSVCFSHLTRLRRRLKIFWTQGEASTSAPVPHVFSWQTAPKK